MASKPKVLLIDDDAIFVFVLRRMMEKTNRFETVTHISNGFEGIETLRECSEADLPDYIFLDLNMPVLDGWQFLEAFETLEFTRTVQLFVISSTIDPREIGKARSYRCVTDFISKPVTQEWLRTL